MFLTGSALASIRFILYLVGTVSFQHADKLWHLLTEVTSAISHLEKLAMKNSKRYCPSKNIKAGRFVLFLENLS